ncbi:RNA 3'-phosphate cyclase, class II [Syntrophotalea carbinolica DSM 2380]|uniref:RNA 3'-terminal phosphate cyclase n=1 Tax=Syntrophotalea carbinolica (strain DSM 2380 / NBRC 103641 / GraBd1) TaxID=338963 RepID=Q3A1M3_SYNC1|nr:RNA 3'-terminal phosphate cyclase [Syntrophotalea carbinolica]ABA89734.1 RNA 3'-phosphate cyclase, class II [Syntrophotalea carbinolica DSM 2380]
MLCIDGSRGEGGGQILRSALALSLVTGTPFRIINIRRGRKRPGLMRQHLAAVHAAAEVGAAEVEGADLHSRQLTFIPRTIRSGRFHFDVGSAGSCTLVLQTVLPALCLAEGPSSLELEGGTHNPFAPPFDFLARAFLPLLTRMGPGVEAHLKRPGFYPAGGGKMTFRISPVADFNPIELCRRGRILDCRARALVANLPRHIAERELQTVGQKLGWNPEQLLVEEITDARGHGNVLLLEITGEHVTEVFSAFGARGVPAEQVARQACGEARQYLAAPVPVAFHLADQLLLPLALAGGGAFRTLHPTPHTLTNIEVIKIFLPVDVKINEAECNGWEIRLEKRR